MKKKQLTPTGRPKRRYYKVGVRKEYFPRESWPKFHIGLLHESWKMLASTRTEAAQKSWEQRKEDLLKRMTPGLKRISFEVNDPTIGVSGLIGRIQPITVYCQHAPIELKGQENRCRYCRQIFR